MTTRVEIGTSGGFPSRMVARGRQLYSYTALRVLRNFEPTPFRASARPGSGPSSVN